MLFIVSVVGFLGAAVFGLVGLSRGDAGQLERILAIACLAMAAAGLVGRWVRAPREAWLPPARHVALSLGDLVTMIAIAPVVALCAGVFLLTLIPSIYVMLPVFAVWWIGSEGRHVPDGPSALPGQLPEPAIV